MAEECGVELIDRARRHGDRTALVDAAGTYSYGDLLRASASAATALLAGRDDLREERVAFLTPPGFDYAVTQWGAWRAGGIAVPLCTLHPTPELEYVISDSKAGIVVAHPEYAAMLAPVAAKLGARFLTTDAFAATPPGTLPRIDPARRALILYTSGTTSKPKGVVTSHACIRAQVTTLVDAWEWADGDRTLHVLPLHHIHGIINILCCGLWSGACIEMVRKFDATAVWERFGRGDLTHFMAVPTVYAKLVAAWQAAPAETRARWSQGCRRMRLMVCGSAALPVKTLEEWREISGHVLLERYGMTEIGMALSNPLRGRRLPGHVGAPLPGVEVRLVDEANRPVAAGQPGEIQVRGPSVFQEYWNRPEATARSFVDGWFRTGDVAVVQDGAWRILGRNSVDIIKTGGYKVSALEIEETLREHAAILECAVIGAPDPEWGERVCAAIVLRPGQGLDLDALRAWGKERLAVYKVPTRALFIRELPRNAMGKVTKPDIVKLFKETP